MKTTKTLLSIILSVLIFHHTCLAQKCHIAFLPHEITYNDSTRHFQNDTMRFKVKMGKPFSKIIARVGGVDIGVTFDYRVFVAEELEGKYSPATGGPHVMTTFYAMNGSKKEYFTIRGALQILSSEKKEDLRGGVSMSDYKDKKKQGVDFTMSCYKL